jgi:hypothetical protein
VTDEIKHPPSTLIGEATSLFYLLGGMAAKHLVIVGGLIPPLLVPEASDAHIGSANDSGWLLMNARAGAFHPFHPSRFVALSSISPVAGPSGSRIRTVCPRNGCAW